VDSAAARRSARGRWIDSRGRAKVIELEEERQRVGEGSGRNRWSDTFPSSAADRSAATKRVHSRDSAKLQLGDDGDRYFARCQSDEIRRLQPRSNARRFGVRTNAKYAFLLAFGDRDDRARDVLSFSIPMRVARHGMISIIAKRLERSSATFPATVYIRRYIIKYSC